MAEIAFLGAGSMVFATKIAGCILSFNKSDDSAIALMDIDEQWLEQMTRETQLTRAYHFLEVADTS